MSRSVEPCLCGDPECKRCFPGGPTFKESFDEIPPLGTICRVCDPLSNLFRMEGTIVAYHGELGDDYVTVRFSDEDIEDQVLSIYDLAEVRV